MQVGIQGIQSPVLKMIGLDLGPQAYSSPLLTEVNQIAMAFFLDAASGLIQLRTAVASFGTQKITGQGIPSECVPAAPRNGRPPPFSLKRQKCSSAASSWELRNSIRKSPAPVGRVSSGRASPRDSPAAIAPVLPGTEVLHNIIHTQNTQFPLLSQFLDPLSPDHMAVVIHHLADDRGTLKSRFPGQINGGFRMAPA